MKHLKKVIALVLTLVTAFAMATPAFAADGDQLATPESTIEATGLTAGDTAEAFQLVEWKDGNWALTTLGASCGVDLDDLIDGISAEEAATIAENVSGSGIAMNEANGKWTATNVAAGLYYVKATPADDNKDTVYNPAFVSADYKEGGNTVDFSTAYENSTVVKSSSVPFDKEVNSETDDYVDVKPGDVIPFKVTTTIPSYGAQFTNPQFKVEDTLSEGLKLDGDVTVTYGDKSATESNDDVTITKSDSGYTVEFKADYLTGLNGATPNVEITYSAEVTTAAANNVTYMDNKAKLTFSNTPTTTQDKEDITRHYTFSIDANLNGGNHGSEKTRELIKIGVDENGETITDFTSWVEGEEWTTYQPLGGATFKLTDADGNEWTAESTAEGYISFNGLDAGTYTLTETAAPAGYVKDSTSYTVVITPTYDGDVLQSYTVTVNDSESSYTITNMSDTDATVETTVDNSSMTFPFVNTKGSELPSTGGMGTKILYTIGGLMVAAGGVFLAAKKRMNTIQE